MITASNDLTADIICNNFIEKVRDFIANDQAFNSMGALKGTPTCWKKVFI